MQLCSQPLEGSEVGVKIVLGGAPAPAMPWLTARPITMRTAGRDLGPSQGRRHAVLGTWAAGALRWRCTLRACCQHISCQSLSEATGESAEVGLTGPPTVGMRGCNFAMPCIMLRGSGGAVALDLWALPAPSTGSSIRLSSELSSVTPCSRIQLDDRTLLGWIRPCLGTLQSKKIVMV